MNSFITITDKEIWDNSYDYSMKPYKYRLAVRVVLMDENNNIAIIHSEKFQFSVLPGGGVETEENLSDAIHREILEETGTKIEIIKNLGQVVEIKYSPHKPIGMIQINHGFVAKKIETLGEPNFEEDEIDIGYELLWVNKSNVEEYLNTFIKNDYNSKFVRARNLIFWNRFLKSN